MKDNTGKTAFDVCTNEEFTYLLKCYEDKKEADMEYIKTDIPISLASIFRGKVYKITKPFMSLKERYMVFDPFQGSLVRYESEADYPKKAK